MNIYVGNLSYGASEDDLKNAFGEFGPVVSVKIIIDRDTGKSKGFAFVEMENQEDAEKAIEALNGSPLDGRDIKVNPARPKTEKFGGGGGPRRRN